MRVLDALATWFIRSNAIKRLKVFFQTRNGISASFEPYYETLTAKLAKRLGISSLFDTVHTRNPLTTLDAKQYRDLLGYAISFEVEIVYLYLVRYV